MVFLNCAVESYVDVKAKLGNRMIRPKRVSAHWAESSVLMLEDIFDLRIIYNFGIASASFIIREML